MSLKWLRLGEVPLNDVTSVELHTLVFIIPVQVHQPVTSEHVARPPCKHNKNKMASPDMLTRSVLSWVRPLGGVHHSNLLQTWNPQSTSRKSTLTNERPRALNRRWRSTSMVQWVAPTRAAGGSPASLRLGAWVKKKREKCGSSSR